MMRTRRKKNWMLTSPRSFKSSNFNSKPRALATRQLNRDAKSNSKMTMRRRTNRKTKARRVKRTKK